MKVAFQNVYAVGCDMRLSRSDGGCMDKESRYVVTLMGRGRNKRGIALEVHGYLPRFLVDLTETSLERELERVARCLGGRPPRGRGMANVWVDNAIRGRGKVAKFRQVRRRRLRGFDEFKLRPFLEFLFDTEAARRRFVRTCYERRDRGTLRPIPGAPPIAESDLDSVVAMF